MNTLPFSKPYTYFRDKDFIENENVLQILLTSFGKLLLYLKPNMTIDRLRYCCFRNNMNFPTASIESVDIIRNYKMVLGTSITY